MGPVSVKPRIGCAALITAVPKSAKIRLRFSSPDTGPTTLSTPYDTAASESFKIAMLGKVWRNTFALHHVSGAVVSTHGSAAIKPIKGICVDIAALPTSLPLRATLALRAVQIRAR
jgi:hypothetical protein